MLVDSHCHLDFEQFRDDLDEVVARAGRAGVGALVTICTRLTELDRVLAIAERWPNVWCAAGIHPHHVAEQGAPSIERLVEIAAHPKVIGLGETGLDYFYDHSPRASQRQSFIAHIEAARRTGLPFIVHTREADADTAAILREHCADGTAAGVMHCFSSGRQLAETAVSLGLHISVAGMVTFRKSDDLRTTIAEAVPAERLLVETDAPFLAPVPMRGRRNEPAYVVHTAAAVAKLKKMPEKEFANLSTRTFFRLFGKATPPRAACA